MILQPQHRIGSVRDSLGLGTALARTDDKIYDYLSELGVLSMNDISRHTLASLLTDMCATSLYDQGLVITRR